MHTWSCASICIVLSVLLPIIVLMSKCMPTRRMVVSVGGAMGRDGITLMFNYACIRYSPSPTRWPTESQLPSWSSS